jgi:hypothetical protein
MKYLMYVDLDLVLFVVFSLGEDIIQEENKVRYRTTMKDKKSYDSISFKGLRGHSNNT